MAIILAFNLICCIITYYNIVIYKIEYNSRDWVQCRGTKMMWGLEHLPYEERLRDCSDSEKDEMGISWLWISEGVKSMGADSLVPCSTEQGATGRNWNTGSSIQTKKNNFMVRMTEHQNRLPREVVDYPSMEIFKVQHIGRNLLSQGLNLISRGPSQSLWFCGCVN